jgi:type I restriction enzyme S subunit
MSWKTEKLENVLAPSGFDRAGQMDYPILSITMHEGLIDQSAKFKKRIASSDISNYRVVYANELVEGFPIDEGVLGFQTKYPAAVVSPAYRIWKLTKPSESHIPFIQCYLRSKEARGIYASKMRGAVARRRSITREDFLDIYIPFPSLDEQKRIAAVLDKADSIRRQRQESLQLTEKLIQSVFIDMFGDPAANPKELPMLELGRFGSVQTGNTPPRSNKANYAETGLEWVKTDNIVEDRVIITPSLERLSEAGAKIARVAPAGSLLVACIAGSEKSIGRAALTDRKVAFNQQINSITPHADTSPLFLYFLVKMARRQIQMAAAKGMKKMINKSTFQGLRFIAPEHEDQLRFERVAERLIEQTKDCQDQLVDLERFFSSLQQRAFRGELDLSRLKLDSESEPPAITRGPEPVVIQGRYKRPGSFIAPPEIEAQMIALENTLNGPGDSIPWSEDYFKYRTLSQVLQAPFSFTEIWEAVEYDMEEASYETVKDKVFEYIATGILEQQFDDTRKEIVFEPRP